MDKEGKRAVKQIRNVTFDENYYQNRAYGAIRSKFAEKYGGGFKREGYSNLERLRHFFLVRTIRLKNESVRTARPMDKFDEIISFYEMGVGNKNRSV